MRSLLALEAAIDQGTAALVNVEGARGDRGRARQASRLEGTAKPRLRSKWPTTKALKAISKSLRPSGAMDRGIRRGD